MSKKHNADNYIIQISDKLYNCMNMEISSNGKTEKVLKTAMNLIEEEISTALFRIEDHEKQKNEFEKPFEKIKQLKTLYNEIIHENNQLAKILIENDNDTLYDISFRMNRFFNFEIEEYENEINSREKRVDGRIKDIKWISLRNIQNIIKFDTDTKVSFEQISHFMSQHGIDVNTHKTNNSNCVGKYRIKSVDYFKKKYKNMSNSL